MSSNTSNDVVVVSERISGGHPDVTYELIGKGREIAKALGGNLHCVVFGSDEGVDSLGGCDQVHLVTADSLDAYNAGAWEEALVLVLAEVNPRLVLTSTGTVGLDLSAALANRLGGVAASYVVELNVEGETLVAVAQLYGGKLMAEADLGEMCAFVSVIPGSVSGDAGRITGVPEIKTYDMSGTKVSMSHVSLNEPERSGIDITASELLVSIGRGIGGASNIEMAQELADALGVPLSASRPVIDQGWLPKFHQVGKSGKKVKPKVYLALGISGAPEHLEGMRSAEMIIACNTDPGAPIFEVAHYGTTVDLFDLVPELIDLIGS